MNIGMQHKNNGDKAIQLSHVNVPILYYMLLVLRVFNEESHLEQ